MFLLPPPETLIKPSALIWTRSSSSVDFHQNVGVKTSWPERRTPCLLFQYHGAEKNPSSTSTESQDRRLCLFS